MSVQLLLDVIGNNCWIHLLINDNLIDLYAFVNEKDLSINLMKNVENLLKKHNLSIANISELYWVYGPGRFSSSRIASIFVKTIKMLYPHIQLLTIDKFDYLAVFEKTMVILQSDGSKFLMTMIDGDKKIIEPCILNQSQYAQILNLENKDYHIVTDNDNKHNFKKIKHRFYSVDENFVLPYFKAPC